METNRWGEDIISKTIYYNDVLEIYTAGITNPNPDYRIMHNICPEEMHFDYYVFEYVLSGVGYIETPEKTYTVSEGDMYFLNKLRYHDYYPDKKNPFKKEFVVVRGALAVEQAEAAAEHISLSEEEWKKIHDEQELYFSGQEAMYSALLPCMAYTSASGARCETYRAK